MIEPASIWCCCPPRLRLKPQTAPLPSYASSFPPVRIRDTEARAALATLSVFRAAQPSAIISAAHIMDQMLSKVYPIALTFRILKILLQFMQPFWAFLVKQLTKRLYVGFGLVVHSRWRPLAEQRLDVSLEIITLGAENFRPQLCTHTCKVRGVMAG